MKAPMGVALDIEDCFDRGLSLARTVWVALHADLMMGGRTPADLANTLNDAINHLDELKGSFGGAPAKAKQQALIDLQPGINAGYQAIAIVNLAQHRLDACKPAPCDGHISQALATIEIQVAVMLNLLETLFIDTP